jgi:hypothetical protein
MEVTVDYRQGVVIGGPPLTDYLASQGILPGCYLHIHRRKEVEYDIYPRLLPEPMEVACKFVEINERGELVTATESVEVRYEHDPDYVISETRLVDMEALWRQATELGLSFFDILVMHVFPRLAPHGEAVHWKKLWEATFQGYRMGTQQAIQRELRRKCFVPVGDGYYRFESSLGYGFPPRKRRPKPQVDRGEQPVAEAAPPPEQVKESQSDTLEGFTVTPPEAPATAESEDQAVQPIGPSLERTRSGQLVAADLVPAGPLFDTPPAAPPSQPPAPLTGTELSGLEEEPSATDDHTPPPPPPPPTPDH